MFFHQIETSDRRATRLSLATITRPATARYASFVRRRQGCTKNENMGRGYNTRNRKEVQRSEKSPLLF